MSDRPTDEDVASWLADAVASRDYKERQRGAVRLFDALTAERVRADALKRELFPFDGPISGERTRQLERQLGEAQALAAWFAADRDWRRDELKYIQGRINSQRAVIYSYESGWQNSFRKQQLDEARAWAAWFAADMHHHGEAALYNCDRAGVAEERLAEAQAWAAWFAAEAEHYRGLAGIRGGALTERIANLRILNSTLQEAHADELDRANTAEDKLDHIRKVAHDRDGRSSTLLAVIRGIIDSLNAGELPQYFGE